MIETRKLAPEWRITIHESGLTIRFWFEADLKYNGIGYIEASMTADAVILEANLISLPERICEFLINEIPSLNSVEVCDVKGNGAALHRDWP